MDERWEQGSDFDYGAATLLIGAAGDQVDLPDGATTWHSGRDALRALVSAFPSRFSRVFFPSFYCQDVALAVRADGVAVRTYADSPALETEDPQPRDLASLGLRAGDAVIVSNTLGLRGISPFEGTLPIGVTVVEDHTHDPFSPWASSSRSDFAFASLRKWCPLPDGAALWSGAGREVPKPPPLDQAHAEITLQRLSGMLLKARYLAGESVEKPAFRELLVSGETKIGHAPELQPGPMSAIARASFDLLPVAAQRAARAENHAHAVRRLDTISGVSALLPRGAAASSALPFALTLVFERAEMRDIVRSALAAARIYGAVLWPIDPHVLPDVPTTDAALSCRLLSLHCDHRYGRNDIDRVMDAVHAAVNAIARGGA